MSSTAPKAAATTLPSGRRFAVCPGCTAVACPISPDATELDCRHCGAHFELVVVTKRKRAARKRPQQTDAPLGEIGGALDGEALSELHKPR